ncbi:MAG TPA: cation-translocating P-type ATPase [Terriglobia bacterium]|nr:cation-translocating P-type ATPase [Terriglobia bacterium]
MNNWYQIDPQAAAIELESNPTTGLTKAEAARRLSEFGRNELRESGARKPWLIFFDQLKEMMVVILTIAAIISALLGDYNDAIAIGAIVVLNAVLGFSQEYRAEKAMAALKKLTVPAVKLRRDGEVSEISAKELVPGDIILLEAGNSVAADCRVLESANLQAQEAALTGESLPVRKTSAGLPQPDLALADRRNMVYMGTHLTSGRGEAVVVETGMRTELGRIAGMIQTVRQESTPLQKRLAHLGKVLAAGAFSIVLLIFALGWLRGEDLKILFLTAVSIAVAAVPEGLPAIMTIALTLGAQRMLRRKVLVRKLSAVETLGSVSVICSDKTGTLTENQMAATVFQLADRKVEPQNRESDDYRREFPDLEQPGFSLMLAGAALCNDAVMRPNGGGTNQLAPLGDPTETALVVAAARTGLLKPELDLSLPRIAEAPFTSERKRMTTIHRYDSDRADLPPVVRQACDMRPGSSIAFTKGAVDVLLGLSNTLWVNGQREPLDEAWRDRLVAENDKLAANGMRVLGLAYRCLAAAPSKDHAEDVESNLTFVGMIGMIDPPRPEAASAVGICKAAGIRPMMITGDHPLTARYIASQLGISDGGTVVTGPQLERTSAEELAQLTESAAVYARVSPEHKLRIVEGLHRRGHIVAMTGDGVNDAPALKKADIGIAMGITGTDVSKEAADMVLLDDNFASIVAAVEEGRVIYDNIRKFIRYILATNSGEIWLMLISPFLGMPLPLLPLQILWMNLVTDGLPALALGVEPAESDAMRRPPRPSQERILARGLGRQILWVGMLMALLSLAIGYEYWEARNPEWQTMVFTTLTLSQMANVMAIRSERRSIFQIGLKSNLPLLGAVGLTVVLQLALIYVPALQAIFKTVALPASDLVVAIAVSSLIFWAVEMEKWMMRRRTMASS